MRDYMSTELEKIKSLTKKEYKYGFVTDIESDALPVGLNEDIIRALSKKKNEPEFLLKWRLKAFERWQNMEEPNWAKVNYPKIDYQKIRYYSAPKKKKKLKSLDEVDPTLLRTYDKLGIPLAEQEKLTGVAVDAVFDSVSVATTFKEKLSELGIIFCSFSEAVVSSVIPSSSSGRFSSNSTSTSTSSSFSFSAKKNDCNLSTILSTTLSVNTS